MKIVLSLDPIFAITVRELLWGAFVILYLFYVFKDNYEKTINFVIYDCFTH